MKKTRLFQESTARFRARSGAILGLATVAALLLIGGRHQFGQSQSASYSSMVCRSARQVTFFSRLKADSRSLVAVVHYLLELEGVSPTNGVSHGIATNNRLPSLAAPTNFVRRVPTV
jgi:hypothetical protein